MDRGLVVIGNAGECRQTACARLGVMALGIAPLADVGRGCDMDLAKRGIGNLARAGAVVARGRDGCDNGDVSVAREVSRDLGQPSNILAAVRRR